jgi:hypothetical protein
VPKVFTVPPHWPTPPAGWTPPPGWQPDPAWGPPPVGWQFWRRPNRHAFAWSLPFGVVLGLVLWAPVLRFVDSPYPPSEVLGELMAACLVVAGIGGAVAFNARSRWRPWTYLVPIAIGASLLCAGTQLPAFVQTRLATRATPRHLAPAPASWHSWRLQRKVSSSATERAVLAHGLGGLPGSAFQVVDYRSVSHPSTTFHFVGVDARGRGEMGRELELDPPQALERLFHGFGATGSIREPGGRLGGWVICGIRQQDPALVSCGWADRSTVGALIFPGSYLLTDAAQLTRRFRTSLEH